MIVDCIVGAVLLISAVIAFLRGFIREVLTILGVVGALAASYMGAPHAVVYINEWLGVEEGVEPERLFGVVPYTLLSEALAYSGIFIVVVIVLSVISHVIAESVKSMGLGAIDRTFGVIFGILRGAVLLGLLYLPVYLLVDQDTKATWFEGSKTHIYLEKSAAMMAPFLPEGTTQKIESDAEKVKEALSAREKLQGIDVLRKDAQEGEDAQPGGTGNKGYNEDFRQNMDQLFRQGSDE